MCGANSPVHQYPPESTGSNAREAAAEGARGGHVNREPRHEPEQQTLQR